MYVARYVAQQSQAYVDEKIGAAAGDYGYADWWDWSKDVSVSVLLSLSNRVHTEDRDQYEEDL